MSIAARENVWAQGRFDRGTGPKKVLFGRMYEDASGRALLPLAGWWPSRLRAFLDLERPAEQVAYWRRHLDTWRLRAAMGILFSRPLLRTAYAAPLLACLPARFGGVVRARMERGFATHPNRTNRYARALLLGELGDERAPAAAGGIRLVHADAAAYLEAVPEGSFDGFTLSNILDGVEDSYRARLFGAVKRAAAPDAVVVLRSFGEPPTALLTNRALEDRAMLWGVVDVKPAASL